MKQLVISKEKLTKTFSGKERNVQITAGFSLVHMEIENMEV